MCIPCPTSNQHRQRPSQGQSVNPKNGRSVNQLWLRAAGAMGADENAWNQAASMGIGHETTRVYNPTGHGVRVNYASATMNFSRARATGQCVGAMDWASDKPEETKDASGSH